MPLQFAFTPTNIFISALRKWGKVIQSISQSTISIYDIYDPGYPQDTGYPQRQD